MSAKALILAASFWAFGLPCACTFDFVKTESGFAGSVKTDAAALGDLAKLCADMALGRDVKIPEGATCPVPEE